MECIGASRSVKLLKSGSILVVDLGVDAAPCAAGCKGATHPCSQKLHSSSPSKTMPCSSRSQTNCCSCLQCWQSYDLHLWHMKCQCGASAVMLDLGHRTWSDADTDRIRDVLSRLMRNTWLPFHCASVSCVYRCEPCVVAWSSACSISSVAVGSSSCLAAFACKQRPMLVLHSAAETAARFSSAGGACHKHSVHRVLYSVLPSKVSFSVLMPLARLTAVCMSAQSHTKTWWC